MHLTSVASVSMKHLIVHTLVRLVSHLIAPVASVVSLIRLVELEISTRKYRRARRRLCSMCPQTLSIVVKRLMTHQARVNMNAPTALPIARLALRVMNLLRVLGVRHHRCRRLVNMTRFTVERIMSMQMRSALSHVLMVIRTYVLPENLAFRLQHATNTRQSTNPTTQFPPRSTAVRVKKMQMGLAITHVLKEKMIVQMECRATLLRRALICQLMNQLPSFQTTDHHPPLLVHCTVELVLKMPRQVVQFRARVVDQMSVLLAKVVMDTLLAMIVTLSIVGQRGMKLHQHVQSHVPLVATMSAIVARFALDILLVVPSTRIYPSTRSFAVQRLRKLP